MDSKLMYSTPIWSLYFAKNINVLKNVQKRATMQAFTLYHIL